MIKNSELFSKMCSLTVAFGRVGRPVDVEMETVGDFDNEEVKSMSKTEMILDSYSLV